MNKIKTLLILTTLILTNSTFARERENIQFYKNEIKEVVETFRIAMIEHDRETFKTLFHSEQIPWIMVFSDEMVKTKRLTKPNFPRTFGGVGSPLRTMKSDNKDKREEKIWNVKIDTDGYLASVHFSYSDHLNGFMRAEGTESWDLVRDDESWKIISVSYVVTQKIKLPQG